MKVFVTGGSGFVGGYLLRRLTADGHQVVGAARSPVAVRAVERAGALSWRGNLADGVALAQALAGCDAVVHAAAQLKFGGPWSAFEAANVHLTRSLLNATREAGVPAFVHISAASVVMRDRGSMLGVKEYAPLADSPMLPYSTTKARSETVVLQAASQALRTVVLRPPFVWGPGDAVDRELGAAIARGRFGWFNGGRYPYATCHVANLSEAVMQALRTSVTGEAFFVTDGEPVELRSFLSRRIAAAGLKVPQVSVPVGLAWSMARALEVSWRWMQLRTDPPLVRETVRLMGYPFTVDIGAAQGRLGYAPVLGVDEGLRQLESLSVHRQQAVGSRIAA